MNRPIYKQKKQFILNRVGHMLNRDAAPCTGPAPDYSSPFYWAASPDKHDASDSIPSSLKEEVRNQTADVFYLYPTTFLSGINPLTMLSDVSNKRQVVESMRTAPWNADLSDTVLNHLTDLRAVLNQATAFNATCRVFAPRYRQAHIKTFFAQASEPSQRALNLAYNDIKEAFEYYLEHYNQGRPIVIASHSQGSLHAMRLLHDYFDGKPLQKQLVCAYIVGYYLPAGAFSHIPFGETPDAIGCFVGWCSYLEGELPSLSKEDENSLCVNPLTWTTSTQEVPKEKNAGMLLSLNKLLPHEVGARIEPTSKVLWVSLSELSSKVLKQITNLHAFDYNLFWMDIRENVRLRVDAYYKNRE
ncbi:DUF3089 domain-containing protein [uncultured Bacteroides sp.]|uniref:DUF3089 domain-containing protein n=1 Tax=uncultured Bacteroides sp. TaxID=162156 RepID=UPI002AA7ED6D|nr:DUF3089 domain-containing protein [uncultured Bacteroides sp.]